MYLPNLSSQPLPIQKFLEDQRSRLQRVTSKSTEENQVYLQQLREMITAFISKANSV